MSNRVVLAGSAAFSLSARFTVIVIRGTKAINRSDTGTRGSFRKDSTLGTCAGNRSILLQAIIFSNSFFTIFNGMSGFFTIATNGGQD